MNSRLEKRETGLRRFKSKSPEGDFVPLQARFQPPAVGLENEK